MWDLVVIAVVLLSILLIDVYAACVGWKSPTAYDGPFLIVGGPYKGRTASRVGIPSIVNWYNSWATANVPATKEEIPVLFPKSRGWTQESWQRYEREIDEGMGPRTFVKVRWSDLKPIEHDEMNRLLGRRPIQQSRN